MSRRFERGFTAVEILVAVFIATVLLGGAYQVYGIVVDKSQEGRERALANNYAGEALKRLIATETTSPCTAKLGTIPTTAGWPSLPSGISISSRTYAISCPFGSTHTVSKVSVEIKYGTPQQEVQSATLTRES